MYPKPIQDLSGWTINHVAAGNTSIIVSADESVISWGSTPTFGELGLGEITKSSTTPKEVTKLTGVKVLGLSMGFGHTLLIAQNETPEEKTKLETFDVFEP
ncbi:Protein RCC2 homolog-like Protein [Tribolium castaneum]|nr:Protein RCC2 homolog-like Protein [Tribolium castaneum]